MPDTLRSTPINRIRAAQQALYYAEQKGRLFEYTGEAYATGTESWPFFHAASRAISTHYFEDSITRRELPSQETARQAFLDFAYMCRIAQREYKYMPDDTEDRHRLRGALHEMILQAIVTGARAAGESTLIATSSAEADYYGSSTTSADNQRYDATLYGTLRDVDSGKERLLHQASLQITSHTDLEHLLGYDLDSVVVVVPTELFEMVPNMPQSRNEVTQLILSIADECASPDALATLIPYKQALHRYISERRDLALMERMLDEL